MMERIDEKRKEKTAIVSEQDYEQYE